MYFDPTLRTDAKPIETKADPFKLGTLIAWLEKQPADGAYCYLSNGACMLAKYFRAHGFEEIDVSAHNLNHLRGQQALPPGFDGIAFGHPRTYGAALDRARNL